MSRKRVESENNMNLTQVENTQCVGDAQTVEDLELQERWLAKGQKTLPFPSLLLFITSNVLLGIYNLVHKRDSHKMLTNHFHLFSIVFT